MHAIMKQITSLPEVIGCMVFSEEAVLFAQDFPSVFDAHTVQEIGTLVTDNVTGLQQITNGVNMLDFRYSSGRIMVRQLAGGYLLLLCSTAAKPALLNISLNVAVKRLGKIIASQPVPEQPAAKVPVPKVEPPKPSRKPASWVAAMEDMNYPE